MTDRGGGVVYWAATFSFYKGNFIIVIFKKGRKKALMNVLAQVHLSLFHSLMFRSFLQYSIALQSCIFMVLVTSFMGSIQLNCQFFQINSPLKNESTVGSQLNATVSIWD